MYQEAKINYQVYTKYFLSIKIFKSNISVTDFH